MRAGSQSYATSADGTRIAYEMVGSGPPVVIVSGAFGTRTDARELAVALSGRFTAAGYDRRGRGDSGDTQPYSPARELGDRVARARLSALTGRRFRSLADFGQPNDVL